MTGNVVIGLGSSSVVSRSLNRFIKGVVNELVIVLVSSSVGNSSAGLSYGLGS